MPEKQQGGIKSKEKKRILPNIPGVTAAADWLAAKIRNRIGEDEISATPPVDKQSEEFLDEHFQVKPGQLTLEKGSGSFNYQLSVLKDNIAHHPKIVQEYKLLNTNYPTVAREVWIELQQGKIASSPELDFSKPLDDDFLGKAFPGTTAESAKNYTSVQATFDLAKKLENKSIEEKRLIILAYGNVNVARQFWVRMHSRGDIPLTQTASAEVSPKTKAETIQKTETVSNPKLEAAYLAQTFPGVTEATAAKANQELVNIITKSIKNKSRDEQELSILNLRKADVNAAYRVWVALQKGEITAEAPSEPKAPPIEAAPTAPAEKTSPLKKEAARQEAIYTLMELSYSDLTIVLERINAFLNISDLELSEDESIGENGKGFRTLKSFSLDNQLIFIADKTPAEEVPSLERMFGVTKTGKDSLDAVVVKVLNKLKTSTGVKIYTETISESYPGIKVLTLAPEAKAKLQEVKAQFEELVETLKEEYVEEAKKISDSHEERAEVINDMYLPNGKTLPKDLSAGEFIPEAKVGMDQMVSKLEQLPKEKRLDAINLLIEMTAERSLPAPQDQQIRRFMLDFLDGEESITVNFVGTPGQEVWLLKDSLDDFSRLAEAIETYEGLRKKQSQAIREIEATQEDLDILAGQFLAEGNLIITRVKTQFAEDYGTVAQLSYELKNNGRLNIKDEDLQRPGVQLLLQRMNIYFSSVMEYPSVRDATIIDVKKGEVFTTVKEAEEVIKQFAEVILEFVDIPESVAEVVDELEETQEIQQLPLIGKKIGKMTIKDVFHYDDPNRDKLRWRKGEKSSSNAVTEQTDEDEQALEKQPQQVSV